MLGNIKGLWDANTKKRRRNNASSISESITESSSSGLNMPQTPALVNDLQAEDVPVAENGIEVSVLISLGY